MTKTITVPNNQELATFKVEFEKSKFDSVVETIGLLTNIKDVFIAEKLGEFKVLN